jgi:TatD DNase family protein
VGEIGLDGYYTLSPMPRQIECFHAFLDLAVEKNLPVVIHVRETFDDVYAALKERVSKGLHGVIHCFTGELHEARAFLELGFHISFSGIVTFKNASKLRDVAKEVPDEQLLIETDSPYLAPVPNRGKVNQPAFVRDVARCLADVRSMDSQALARMTLENGCRLFKMPLNSLTENN